MILKKRKKKLKLVEQSDACPERISFDPDNCLGPTSFYIPKWGYQYGAVLHDKGQMLLEKSQVDEGALHALTDDILANLGQLYASIEMQLANKVFLLSEIERTLSAKVTKMEGQLQHTTNALADCDAELTQLKQLNGDGRPIF